VNDWMGVCQESEGSAIMCRNKTSAQKAGYNQCFAKCQTDLVGSCFKKEEE